MGPLFTFSGVEVWLVDPFPSGPYTGALFRKGRHRPADPILMKKILRNSALLGLLALLPSCQSLFSGDDPGPNRSWDHWNADSIPPRVDRFFLGYDSDRDGAYSDKLKADFAHVRKTCQRVFLNYNSDNPFQN